MGLSEQKINLNGRRIAIASYVEEITAQPASNLREQSAIVGDTDRITTQSTGSLRQQFPAMDVDYMGGHSDGHIYQSTFAGRNLEATYEMIRAFLQEEGYHDVPLPKDVEELLAFRLATRNRQVLLFEDNGYVHNPVKILFPMDRRKKSTLILKIYNEQAKQHLLRFHNKL